MDAGGGGGSKQEKAAVFLTPQNVGYREFYIMSKNIMSALELRACIYHKNIHFWCNKLTELLVLAASSFLVES